MLLHITHLSVTEPTQVRAHTMAVNGGRFPVPLEQLTTKLQPRLHHKPISDIELVERYCFIHIHDKLARMSEMREPNLRLLVALFNMYDAIAFGEYKQDLQRIRAHHNDMYTSSSYERKYCKTGDGLSSATTHYDESLQIQLDSLHLNF